jgi:hypothetical protein
MIEQTGSVNQMTQDEVLEMMFHQEHQEYLEQYFNDLREAMNEQYYEMEVENATI